MTTALAHEPGTPCWLDLMTPDPEQARDFYAEIFGWDYEVGPPETGHYAMCLVNGRQAAGIGQLPRDAPFPTAWTVYFASADADATAAKAVELGGSIVMGPMDVMDAGRMLVAADPTGAVFGVWQPGVHKGAGVVREPGSLSWCEVNTRGAATARDFYAALFGLTAKPLPMPDFEYFTLHRGEETLAGVMQMNAQFPAEVPPHWLPYLAVADTDEVCVRIDAAGGSVLVEAKDTPYGRMAVVADPFGAAFAILAAPPS
jgi:predicted enzyme related to lactoylglutathione lyase